MVWDSNPRNLKAVRLSKPLHYHSANHPELADREGVEPPRDSIPLTVFKTAATTTLACLSVLMPTIHDCNDSFNYKRYKRYNNFFVDVIAFVVSWFV